MSARGIGMTRPPAGQEEDLVGEAGAELGVALGDGVLLTEAGLLALGQAGTIFSL
jgi:hypothetical protein